MMALIIPQKAAVTLLNASFGPSTALADSNIGLSAFGFVIEVEAGSVYICCRS
jgi:hypothetical protein